MATEPVRAVAISLFLSLLVIGVATADEPPKAAVTGEPESTEQDNGDAAFEMKLQDLAKDPPPPAVWVKPDTTALLPADPPMTPSEYDFIRSQFIPCWNYDRGLVNPEKYTVVVRIGLREDGTITDAQLVSEPPWREPHYYAAAGRALAAVQNPACQPLRLPKGKFWPQLDIVFDLAKAINGGY